MMNRRANLSVVLLFTVFLGAFFIGNLLYPDRDFSPLENRSLQTMPAFSFSALFRGDYTEAVETYGSDQFILRDQWIMLKARLELMQGKKSNNGIFLCAGERLLEPFSAPDSPELDKRLSYVESLANNTSIPVTLALIPTSAEIYRDSLPAGVINDSQIEILQHIAENSPVNVVDIISPLLEHKDDNIFYRTDHHWTTMGAFYGYQALADALGFSPHEYTFYEPQTVSEDFCGTTYSFSGFFWVVPDEMQIYVEPPEGASVTRYESEPGQAASLYDYSMLETKDKYRFFLGGNTPRAVIQTGHEGLPSLLLLRDSYADALVPFLLDNYSEIHLLDLRYYWDSVAEYTRDQGIDSILVLYGLSNFCTDTYLALMTR